MVKKNEEPKLFQEGLTIEDPDKLVIQEGLIINETDEDEEERKRKREEQDNDLKFFNEDK